VLSLPEYNFCDCPDGYVGNLCEGNGDELSVCTEVGLECQNGGTCILATEMIGGQAVDANYCKCPDSTFGALCHGKHSGGNNNINGAGGGGTPFQEATEAAAEASFAEAASTQAICTENGGQCQNGGFCIMATPDGSIKANNCRCPDGFMGDRCHGTGAAEETFAVICTEDGGQCQNGGFCVMATADGSIKANNCRCPDGFSGERCHGTPFQEATKAAAEENFAEASAEVICTEDGGQCQNGGFCAMATPDGSIKANNCKCPQGYTGNRCHSPPINSTGGSSDSNNVNSGSNNVNSGSNNVNSSGSGSESKVCTLNGNECQNGSSCILATTDGKVPANYCECINNYFGTFCHGKHSIPTSDTSSESKKDPVCTKDSNQCENGGICVLATSQKDSSVANYCSCPESTSGIRCGGQLDCNLECQHGSSCRHYDDIAHDGTGKTAFYCECVGNYKGMECEIPYTTCAKKSGDKLGLDCLYGGECVEPKTDSSVFTCACPKGRSGKNCEVGVDSSLMDYNGSCYSDVDCENGGLCIRHHDAEKTEDTGMLTKATQCLCAIGWGGENCELRCNSLNCQHGSSCRFSSPDDVTHANDSIENGAHCDCKDDSFKGLECEIAVKKCPGINGMECLYGGACVGSQDDSDGNFYTCECPAGRTGNHCERIDPNVGNSNLPDRGNLLPQLDKTKYDRPTSSLSRSQMKPDFLVIAIVGLLFLLIIPVTLMCLAKNRNKRNAELQESVAETLDGMSATDEGSDAKITNGDGSNRSHGQSSEDIFDYDIDGVVNVDLDENEPVQLSKDKQIV